MSEEERATAEAARAGGQPPEGIQPGGPAMVMDDAVIAMLESLAAGG